MAVIRRPTALVIVLLAGLLVATYSTSVQAQQAATISMQDFRFVGLPARMQPGTYNWTVVNEGKQPHVLDLYELLPGKTFRDVYAVLNGPPRQGPPTGLFAGDAAYAALFAAPAKSFSSPITLHPGNYIAICPIPDAASGAPHFALGMVAELRVRADAPATAPAPAPVALPDTGAAETSTFGLVLVAFAAAGVLCGGMLRRRARRV